jgi:two-component system, sensor histidine kinase
MKEEAMLERITRALDRTIPGAILAEPGQRSRARMVQCFYALGVLGFFTAALVQLWAAGELMLTHPISIALFVAGFFLLRLTGSLQISAGFALAIGLAGVVGNAVQLGGLVFILTWGSVFVGGALYMLGLRAAMIVGAASILIAFAIAAAHVSGVYPPLSPEVLTVLVGSGTRAAIMIAMQIVTMLLFLGFYHREHRLLNESLVQARIDAEASDRAKSVFLATMSHEIRTPMNGVLAAADLLRRSDIPPEEKALAEIVYSSGDALLSLLNDILDLSKLEAGKVQLETLPFNPRELARSVVELLRHRAKQKSLQLDLEIDSTVPVCLLGDASRLRQVLLNLLGNAVKFTDKGRVRLVIGPGERGVVFRVEDTGPGLDASQRSQLFQRFVQTDSSVHRTHGGTGLGLAISRHLVEAMGGHIDVDSEVGQGSVFHFELTLAEGVMVEPETLAEQTGDVPRLDGLVLVVDDNAVNRKVAENMLHRLGCETASAADGIAALEQISKLPVALVLMDRQMPVLDGLDTTRRIRALGGKASATPVVGLTASVFTEEVADCLEAGMQAVLSKPVTMRALSGALRNYARQA